LSDLATLNSALSLYTTDQAGTTSFSLGNASSVYVSLPDSSSTCGSWSLPTPPAGYSYACYSSTSSRNIDSTGWVPVNFSLLSSGSPIGQLPVDPTNQSSTGLYYTYYTNGSQFVVTAIPESQKQKTTFGIKSTISNYPDVLANGSSLTISPLFNTSGLVGYWNFDEGSGSTATDQSGSGNNLSLTTQAWASGRIGPGALQFSGSSPNLAVASSGAYNVGPSGNATISFWFKAPTRPASDYFDHLIDKDNGTVGYAIWLYSGNTYGNPDIALWTSSGSGNHYCYTFKRYDDNNWHLGQFVIDRTNGCSIYVDGIKDLQGGGTVASGDYSNSTSLSFGQASWAGQLDDVRFYNRVLSAAEIQAMYNAEK
jgi:hypothetical protein